MQDSTDQLQVELPCQGGEFQILRNEDRLETDLLLTSQIFSDLLRSQRSRRALKSASSSSVSTARTKSVRPPVVSTAALPRRHPRHPGLADTAVAAPRICGPGSLENSQTKKIGKKPGEFLENETYETLEAIPSHSEPFRAYNQCHSCLGLSLTSSCQRCPIEVLPVHRDKARMQPVKTFAVCACVLYIIT